MGNCSRLFKNPSILFIFYKFKMYFQEFRFIFLMKSWCSSELSFEKIKFILITVNYIFTIQLKFINHLVKICNTNRIYLFIYKKKNQLKSSAKFTDEIRVFENSRIKKWHQTCVFIVLFMWQVRL